jgi:hypothetical protein
MQVLCVQCGNYLELCAFVQLVSSDTELLATDDAVCLEAKWRICSCRSGARVLTKELSYRDLNTYTFIGLSHRY